jgi:hypothetical protein
MKNDCTAANKPHGPPYYDRDGHMKYQFNCLVDYYSLSGTSFCHNPIAKLGADLQSAAGRKKNPYHITP